MAEVALAALLWGLGGALAGRFMHTIPPGVLIPLRFWLSFLLLLPLALKRPPPAFERGRLFLVGLSLAGAQAFYYLAIHAVGVASGIFLQYLAPALLTLYALARGQRLPRRSLVGVGLAIAGAYLLLSGGQGLSGDALGVAYGLLSAVSFALYAAFAEGLKTPAFTALGVASGVGAALSLPALGLKAGAIWALGPEGALAALYLAVFGTVLPFGLFFLGVRKIPARLATLVALIEPLSGALFAVPLAGQPLTLGILTGGGLILLGVFLNRGARG